jgi:hypothetical protein
MSEKFPRRRAIAASALLLGGAFAIAGPSSAHHSTAMFEWGTERTLNDAVVERWEWTNPHTFLYVRARDENGTMRRWAFEGMSPNHLVRYGWGRRSLEQGQNIDLTYYPLRDGRTGGFNVTVKFEDGHSLNQFRAGGTTQ